MARGQEVHVCRGQHTVLSPRRVPLCLQDIHDKNFSKTLSYQLKALAAKGKLSKIKASFKLGEALKAQPKKKPTKGKRGAMSACLITILA